MFQQKKPTCPFPRIPRLVVSGGVGPLWSVAPGRSRNNGFPGGESVCSSRMTILFLTSVSDCVSQWPYWSQPPRPVGSEALSAIPAHRPLVLHCSATANERRTREKRLFISEHRLPSGMVFPWGAAQRRAPLIRHEGTVATQRLSPCCHLLR